MKRTLIYIVLWTITSYVGYAQQTGIDSLLKQLPQIEAGRPRVDALNKLAFAYTLVSVLESEKFTREALKTSQSINYPSGLAESFKILGIIYYVRGEFNLATQYSYEALKLYEKLLDKTGQGKVLNNLALISLAQMDYEKVYELTMKSLAIKRAEGDSAGVAGSNLALAEVYLNQQQYTDAMNHCKAAMEQYTTSGNDWGMCHALLVIGEIYHAQRNYPFAFSYYTDALRYARLSSDHIQVINASKKLGQLYLQTNRFDSAYFYLKNALTLARQKNNRNNEMQADQSLADYFTARNILDSALFYTRSAMGIEREIFNHQKTEQMATLQMLYTFEKKDQELNFQKKIVRRQYVAIVGVCLILLLTIVLGFKFYKLNKVNRQAKIDMIKLNYQVSQMNENLETIVQDRTDKIKSQNQKLIEFTFFTAHELRGPVARILGLIELAKLKELNDEDRNQILQRLEEASVQLDEVIRVVNRKLEKGEQLTDS
jgi:tetratricopeptide (TPR) repeat protein